MNTANTASSRSIRRFVAAIVVALICIANAGTAQASEPLTKKIAYSDLDANTEAGAKLLYARLRFAAREVCTPYESIELSRRRAWQTCVNNALTSAVQQINKPTVTALHSMSVDRYSPG
jgi:UrcA family protein